MKLYGNLNNRFDENRYFNGTLNNIKVGTLCTIYSWSDRHAYEVVEVTDQEHIAIRQLKAIRTDGNGMSDSQTYRYESNPKNPIQKLVLKNGKWREANTYTKERYEKAIENSIKSGDAKERKAAEAFIKYHFRCNITEKQFERMMDGKEITKLGEQVNISFGVADQYYDYSF